MSSSNLKKCWSRVRFPAAARTFFLLFFLSFSHFFALCSLKDLRATFRFTRISKVCLASPSNFGPLDDFFLRFCLVSKVNLLGLVFQVKCFFQAFFKSSVFLSFYSFYLTLQLMMIYYFSNVYTGDTTHKKIPVLKEK